MITAKDTMMRTRYRNDRRTKTSGPAVPLGSTDQSHSPVMMVGPSAEVKGGITTVVNDYRTYGLFKRLNVTYYATYDDGTKIDKNIRAFISGLAAILRDFSKYAILHIHSSYGWSFRRLSMVAAVAMLARKRVLMHIHGSMFDVYERRASSLERWWIRYILSRVDRVIVLSDDWAKRISQIAPKARLNVLPNAVDVNQYSYAGRRTLGQRPYKVLFLGRLGERKGAYDLLKAAALIPSGLCSFILAGDGEVEKVQEAVRKLGMEDRFLLPGWVGIDERKRLLREASLFVLPSYHEGLPMAILEAMAAALPVVSTRVGGIPDAVKDGVNGRLIEAGDVRALADALIAVLGDPSTWASMSEASRASAEEGFSLGRVEESLGLAYREATPN